MAEDEGMAFDPSLKKKKKKKKAFDLDAALAEDGAPAPAPAASEDNALPVAAPVKAAAAPAKVTKADPAFDEAEAERAAAKAASKAEALNMDDLELELADLDLDSFGEKKKKKKKKRKGEDAVAEENGEDIENQENIQASKSKQASIDRGDGNTDIQSASGETTNQEGKSEGDATAACGGAGAGDPWTGTDRDYTYDELLKRVFGIMEEKHPDMAARHTKGFVMRPPQVVRSGTKKTAFVNFMDIAKALHRQPKHLLAFLQAELGTVGTIDGSNQLILKGKFQQRNIETVLRKYIKEYVFCHTCRSPDTILNKDVRLFFLQCNTCRSKCSVQSIKTGFQAVTGKRSAMRAKNE